MPNKLHEYKLKAPEHAKEIMDVTNQSTSMGAAMFSESKISPQPDNIRNVSHKKEYLLMDENKKYSVTSTFVEDIKQAIKCWVGSKVIRYSRSKRSKNWDTSISIFRLIGG